MLRIDPPPVKGLFLVSAAWNVAMVAFENTHDPRFLETASHLEKLWILEAKFFHGFLSLWIRCQ